MTKCPECHNQFDEKYGSNWDWVPCQTCKGAGFVEPDTEQLRKAASYLNRVPPSQDDCVQVSAELIRAADEIDAARAEIVQLRQALKRETHAHGRVAGPSDNEYSTGYCFHCGVGWPCDASVRLRAALGASREAGE